MVVEGAVLLQEAADAGFEIESQFVAPGGHPVGASGEVFDLAPGVMERIASTESPQSVIGIVSAPHSDPRVLAAADFVVVAGGVSDPGNLGTMMRSAAGSGAAAFVVTRGTVDHTSPKVVRASAGTIFRLPIVELSGLDDLRHAGLVLIGTTSHSAHSYTDVDLTRRIALLLGNEPHGLAADVDVDEWTTVPLARGVESLNVAMACAVLCFEVARQRRALSGTVAPT